MLSRLLLRFADFLDAGSLKADVSRLKDTMIYVPQDLRKLTNTKVLTLDLEICLVLYLYTRWKQNDKIASVISLTLIID